MNNKSIFLICLILNFIQCSSHKSMKVLQEPDFVLMQNDLFNLLKRNIDKFKCDINDNNVLRSNGIISFITEREADELYELAKNVYPTKEWDKMYFIYYFSDNTDPIFGKMTIVFSNGRESWGLSKKDNQKDYIRTYDCKNINIWDPDNFFP